MTDVIEVSEVIEMNDCAGKKSFFVTAQSSDETFKTYYRLNHGVLPPQNKLFLASVAPMDQVQIANTLTHNLDNPQVVGEYYTLFPKDERHEALCRCGTPLVSNGYDIHCPNNVCPLTLATRLRRLAETSFFNVESLTIEDEHNRDGLVFSNIDDYKGYCCPFAPISTPTFWGEVRPVGTLWQNHPPALEDILLTRKIGYLTLDTFLVNDLFEEFLTRNPAIHLNKEDYQHLYRFYGWMDEATNRRDTGSFVQNGVLTAFLWSLGLESLRMESIEAMFAYERDLGFSDPAVVFAYILVNPKILVEQLGIHPIEALAIRTEVSRRKIELREIFYHYALNKQDLTSIFLQMT